MMNGCLLNQTGPMLNTTNLLTGYYFCQASNNHGTVESRKARFDALKTKISCSNFANEY